MLTEHRQSLSAHLLNEFKQARQRTETIFNLISPDAYYKRPIPLRHPFVFYEGHIPAFIWNTLFRTVLKQKALYSELDELFARGIDPLTLNMADTLNQKHWPTRQETRHYRDMVYEHLYAWLEQAELKSNPHPMLRNGYILHLLLEHELMHQETLMYIIHQLPPADKKPPKEPIKTIAKGIPHQASMQEIPDGSAILGAYPDEFDFVWDNEQPALEINVPGFAMDVYNVTNDDFMAFVEDGGYSNPAWWDPETWKWCQETPHSHPFFWKRDGNTWLLRDLFGDIPLPSDWPVYVTQAEARAYARYTGKELPTEAQWHRAAVGDNHHWHYPWGDDVPTPDHGNFNFERYSPVPVGSFPKGASPYGIHDLVGNGWEWTSTPFMPFPGFKASDGYPQYSADFFDGQHYVIKGGSPFTATRLLRRPFRNWFYWHYPYAYTTFRCASND